MLTNGIFGHGSSFKERYIQDHQRLADLAASLKVLGQKVVLTMGTFDLLHVGHSRYLEAGRNLGDFLIVGVDSDEKVRRRKGPRRPIVSENERLEILCHHRHVDAVILKHADDPKWSLIKLIRPDVLLATKETYTVEELEQLKEYCGEVIVLEPQATTSTTARIRQLFVDFASTAKERITKKIQEALDELIGGE